MKKIITISIFLMFGCATSINMAPETGDTILTDEAAAEIVEKAKSDPESFERCMRYDEIITLTAEEELALLEHCLGL